MKQKLQKSFFFQEVHPCNFLLAYVLSYICPVYFWQSKYIPNRFLSRFQGLYTIDIFTHDEWNQISERNHSKLQSYLQELQKTDYFIKLKIQSKSIDYTKHFLQVFAIQYEKELLFFEIVNRFCKLQQTQLNYVFSPFLYTYRNQIQLHFSEFANLKVIEFRVLDYLWQFLTAFLVLVKQYSHILNSKKSQKIDPCIQKIDCIWKGIGPVEVANAKHKLDHTFFSKQFKDQKKHLYLFPNTISASSIQHNNSEKNNWVYETKFLSNLSSHELLLESIRLLQLFFSLPKLLRKNAFALAYFPNILRSAPWVSFVQKYQPKVFLSSVSANWPEDPAVAVMNSLNVKTVMWYYGSNIYYYSTNREQATDKKINQSIFVTTTVWVWNSLSKDFLLNKLIKMKDYPTEIQIIGPVMCGDPHLSKEFLEDIKQKYGINSQKYQYLGVFDVPSIGKELTRILGLGPEPYPIALLEQFYIDIKKLLEQNKNLAIIFKPKRSLKTSNTLVTTNRLYPDSLFDLIEDTNLLQQKGKLIVLEHDINPYIPVALSDICLGIPFTSQIIIGLRSLKPSFFYDPLKIFNYFSLKNFEAIKPLLIQNEAELQSTFTNLLHNTPKQDFTFNNEEIIGPNKVLMKNLIDEICL